MPVSAVGDGLELSIDEIYNATDAVAQITVVNMIVITQLTNIAEAAGFAALTAAFCHCHDHSVNSMFCNVQISENVETDINCVFIVNLHN